jgi:hypothetical protein
MRSTLPIMEWMRRRRPKTPMPDILVESFTGGGMPSGWYEGEAGVHAASWDYRVNRLADGPSLALTLGDPLLASAAFKPIGLHPEIHMYFEFMVSGYPPGFLEVNDIYDHTGSREISNIYLFKNGHLALGHGNSISSVPASGPNSTHAAGVLFKVRRVAISSKPFDAARLFESNPEADHS